MTGKLSPPDIAGSLREVEELGTDPPRRGRSKATEGSRSAGAEHRLADRGEVERGIRTQAFATKYEKYLIEEVAALRAMAKHATDFAKKIQTALDMLEKDEDAAKSWLDGEAAKIQAVYISKAKQAALDEFDKHPTPSNLARLKRYRY